MTKLKDLEAKIKKAEAKFNEYDSIVLLKPYYDFVKNYKKGKIKDNKSLEQACVMIEGLLY